MKLTIDKVRAIFEWLVRNGQPCDCDVGEPLHTARARIVAMMRRKATAHARLSRLRSSPRARQWWDLDRANEHEGAEVALDTMADRIERGEP